MNITNLKTILQKDKNKILVLLDQTIVSGGNFVLALVLIRLLGLETYGLFAMLWLGVLFGLSMHQSFITKPLMTLASDKKEGQLNNYFHSLWTIQLGGSLILFIGILFLTNIVDMTSISWLQYLPLTGGITICYLLQDFIKKTYFLKQKIIQPLLIDSLTYSLLFVDLLILEYLGMSNLWNTLFILLGSYAISSLLFCKHLFQKDTTIISPSWLAIIKEHYHFSYWLLGTSILQWFSGNFFLVAAASTLGTTAVGAVRMSQNLVGLCHILFLAMENIVPAEAAQHFSKKGMTSLIVYLKQISIKIGGFLLLILFTMTLTAPFLIEILYGAEYAAYSFVVWGYCLLYAIVFLGYPVRYYFRTIQSTKPIFFAYLLSAAFSMVAAFPLLQVWGIMGLIIGLIVSQLLTLLIYLFFLLGSITNSQQGIRRQISAKLP